jgi:hypothetical protein
MYRRALFTRESWSVCDNRRLRLCRVPCGKPLAFRPIAGSSARLCLASIEVVQRKSHEAEPRHLVKLSGKPEAFRKECGKAAVQGGRDSWQTKPQALIEPALL